MLKKILYTVGIVFLLYLFFYPINLPLETWVPKKHPGYDGDYKPNDLLTGITKAGGPCAQCEDVHLWRGQLVGGELNGKIIAFEHGERSIIADTKGRPLGLDEDANGNLIIADAKKGLLSLDSLGTLTTLTTTSDGVPFKFTDDVEVAPNGKIYFSDASSEYQFEEVSLEAFIHGTNGRLLEFDPATGATSTLMDDLAFANGVAVSSDGSFVLVNETFEYRVNKYWISGPKAGTSEHLIDNLPGFPDGISRGENGIFWLAIIGQRIQSMDALLSGTFGRKLLARLPFLMPKETVHYNMILGLDSDGQIIYNLQDPSAMYQEITSVHQEGDTLYLGTLKDEYIGMYIIN